MQAKKLFTLVMVFTILFFNNVFANIPNHTEAFYVNDFAGVLSPETMAHIVERNLSLSEVNGAQIVVTTVHFVDGIPIEDYAMEMFNQWGIGDSVHNNGVLLLLAVGQEDFFVSTGDGLDNIMSAGDVSIMLSTHLEPYFDASNYDEGTRNIFDEMYHVISRHHIPSPSNTNIVSTNTVATNSFDSSNLIFFILFIAMIIYAPRMSIGRRGIGRSKRRGVPLWIRTSWLNNASARRGNNNQARKQSPLGRSSSLQDRFTNHTGGGGRTSGGVGRQNGGSRLGGGGRTSGGGVGRRRK